MTKVIRWLRSRPLRRVRRNLATEKRIMAQLRRDRAILSSEVKAYYDREFAQVRAVGMPRPLGQRRRVTLYDGPVRRWDEV